MVTAFFQLHHRRAGVAFLPSFLLGCLDELFRRGILGAVAGGVGFVVTDRADTSAAAFAFPYLPAVFGRDVIGFDPLAAAPGDAVDFILGLVFEEFPVPVSLEGLVEEFVHVFQVDVRFCAAARRHVCGVGDG